MAESSENKVQFNLKNVYYAVMTANTDTPSWATPVKVPGAVSLNLSQQGEVTQFHADGIVYYQTVSNNGYNGDLEMARFPDRMLKDIWAMEEAETDFVLLERSDVEPKAFALLFEIDGDVDKQLYCLYNCSGTRPAIAGSTNTTSKDVKTQSSTISAVSTETGYVMARTTAKTPSSVRENWFKSVYQQGA